MTSPPEPPSDPAGAMEWLAAAERPCLIGVRHHSPVLAAAMPALLDALRPDVVLVELPMEFEPWLPWLGHADARAPFALAGVAQGAGAPLAFYPFADFSPELVAIRWALRHGVEVAPCDLPLAARAWTRDDDGRSTVRDGPSMMDVLRRRLTGRADGDVWDRLVEVGAADSPPESVRRAALAVGWALRQDRSQVDHLDLAREAWMRACIARAERGPAHESAHSGPVRDTGAFPLTAPGASPPGASPPGASPHGRSAPGASPPGPSPHGPSAPGASRHGSSSPGASPESASPHSVPPHGAASTGATRRVAVVVGAFHAPALVKPGFAEADLAGPPTGGDDVVTSLVPYPFELLDSRSGYPAGILDPQWQQEVFECGGQPAAVEGLAAAFAVRVAVALRAAGHPAGPAEAREVARLAGDLARLRGLPAPGRGEVVEALQTVLAQGEVLGRGRAVADAMQRVLVGNRHGRLARDTPRSGLLPAVLALLDELRLPGAGEPPQTLRLDPLRSPLDRRREITLARLDACGVPYAEAVGNTGAGGVEALTTRWRVAWRPATEATIAVAGLHGVTLEQAAEGVLRKRRRDEQAAGGPTARQALAGFTIAAAAGLPDLTAGRLGDVERAVGGAGTLAEIIEGLDVLDRVARAHVPGTPEPPAGCTDVGDVLEAAAVREVGGLVGSDRLEDARALVAVAHRADRSGRLLRLHDALRELAERGTPLMQGAAGAVGVLIGLEPAETFGERLASWIDIGGDDLRPRLSGALIAASALLAAEASAIQPLMDRIERLADSAFTRRLPALRGGFDVLSPAARDRLQTDLEARFGGLRVSQDPDLLARWLVHDQAGRAAVEALPARDAAVVIPAAQRWRLVLGRRTDELPPALARRAVALDELYGAGRGEGSREVGRGGRERPLPSVREWQDELEELFGAEVCHEVLGEAARRGNRAAALALSPDEVRPSVELLHTVLAMTGGLPEAQLARLRPLVARVVAELTARLATQLRPALAGLTTARPTRRRTGTVDLPATIRANLRSATTLPDGRRLVVPERVRYKSRSRRSVDWRLILVVDVSGSMEASTVWAALTSAILAGLPAMTTHFVTFSTDVVDLSGHANDPLSLLLEVSVGGGTHIAAGLRYARGLVTVPSRTMVAVVSDFEEGFPLDGLLSEVRLLAESGCRLLGCASLDDRARPRYAVGVAEQLVVAGMPVAALSPLALAQWVAEQVR